MSAATRERFQSLFQRPAGDIYDRIVAGYAEPARHYHTLDHISACLGELDRTEMAEGPRRLIELALWWHDAIYDPTKPDNEAKSAVLARENLAAPGEDEGVIEEVARLIMLTVGHSVPAGDVTGATMVSIDLSILGRSPAVYDWYAGTVRAEYAHVPEAPFRAGRAMVMSRFLEAPYIFADPAFRARFEDQARANIAREIATLQAGA